jgi:nitrite reductase (NADH) small subunit
MSLNWVRVASTSECPPGTSIELVVRDRIVALFNVAGTLYALDGVCPHQGGPLARGQLTGCILTCPWHGWQFDVRDGRHQLNQRLQQPQFPVRTEGDSILLGMEENE